MSCSVCEETPMITYVRVGRANVQIAGCEEHLTELIRLLRLAHKKEDEAKL